MQTQSADPTWPTRRLTETPDGALAVEDLTPGSYVVKVSIGGPRGTDGVAKSLLRAEAPFTVPSQPATGTLDLGEIVLQSPTTK
jgi:hypothetical protein